eukprot:12941976-Alexandrium_andersonii.AAC.1
MVPRHFRADGRGNRLPKPERAQLERRIDTLQHQVSTPSEVADLDDSMWTQVDRLRRASRNAEEEVCLLYTSPSPRD